MTPELLVRQLDADALEAARTLVRAGFSVRRLAKQIGVTRASAYTLVKRYRVALEQPAPLEPPSEPLEPTGTPPDTPACNRLCAQVVCGGGSAACGSSNDLATRKGMCVDDPGIVTSLAALQREEAAWDESLIDGRAPDPIEAIERLLGKPLR